MSHVEITTGPRATDAKVILDGHDISNGLRGYEIRHEGPSRPVVLLHPAIFDTVKVDLTADVYVSPAASDLLCRLGWTPPAGASP